MTTTISADNGVVSGSAGLKSTSDGSGVLALQTGANITALTLNASQNAVFAGTLTSGAITSTGAITSGTGALYPLVSGISVSASGTSVDFTGIPATAKRITIMLSGVSTTGTNQTMLQLGTSGGIDTTNYAGMIGHTVTGNVATAAPLSGGFQVVTINPVAANNLIGTVDIANISGNIWQARGSIAYIPTTPRMVSMAGNCSLTGVLDRIRITTVGGIDTFDAGTINIMWE